MRSVVGPELVVKIVGPELVVKMDPTDQKLPDRQNYF